MTESSNIISTKKSNNSKQQITFDERKVKKGRDEKFILIEFTVWNEMFVFRMSLLINLMILMNERKFLTKAEWN